MDIERKQRNIAPSYICVICNKTMKIEFECFKYIVIQCMCCVQKKSRRTRRPKSASTPFMKPKHYHNHILCVYNSRRHEYVNRADYHTACACVCMYKRTRCVCVIISHIILYVCKIRVLVLWRRSADGYRVCLVFLSLASDQGGSPAEFKHISKRRKRN